VWDLFFVGSGFAICASGVSANASVTALFKDNHSVKQVGDGLYQGVVSVKCPSGETLVGGGVFGSDGNLGPWSRLAMADSDSTQWQVALNYEDSGDPSVVDTGVYAGHTVDPHLLTFA
jgi:hypothetical protein